MLAASHMRLFLCERLQLWVTVTHNASTHLQLNTTTDRSAHRTLLCCFKVCVYICNCWQVAGHRDATVRAPGCKATTSKFALVAGSKYVQGDGLLRWISLGGV